MGRGRCVLRRKVYVDGDVYGDRERGGGGRRSARGVRYLATTDGNNGKYGAHNPHHTNVLRRKRKQTFE